MFQIRARCLGALLLTLGAGLFAVSVSAAGVNGSTVSYPSGPDTVSAFLAEPGGPGPHPGILVVHEWWGLNEWVKEQAKRLAGLGYTALAIDLYRGKVTDSPEKAHELMRGLPNDRAAQDLTASLAFLKARAGVAPSRLGAIGWCMGGGFVMDAALNHAEVGPTVICYGRVTTSPGDGAKFTGPVLGIFGAEDDGLPEPMLRKFEKSLKDAGKSVTIEIYKGAGHAFMNPGNPWKGYRPTQAADAWKKIETFFAANLKPVPAK